MRILIAFASDGNHDLVAAVLRSGGEVLRCEGMGDAPEAVRLHKPDAVVFHESQGVPGLSEVVSAIKARHRCACVLVGEAYTAEALSRATHSRVDALLVQPVSVRDLAQLVVQEHASGPARPGLSTAELVGDTLQMRDVCRRVAAASRSKASVLVTGETGTGKELVAHALHNLSPRKDRPFVAVSCGALPETLVESELFGHEKGAFTGASELRRGRFELADGGTLFLDEVGELKESVQVKLLRVLQERVFERVGSNKSIGVDVRVIAATNRQLEQEVQRGHFRADLFYRLNVLNIHLAPLRERQADIMPLWRHLLQRLAGQDGRAVPITAPRVATALLQHAWPGNIRELENVAHHALTMATRGTITVQHLPPYLTEGQPGPRPSNTAVLGMTLRELERAAITGTYEATGSARATAQVLGISLRKVHYRLKQYREAGWCIPDRDAGATPVDATPSSATRKVRVLLAEDDDELRWALEELLTDEGYDVKTVTDGAALKEQVRTGFPQQASDRSFDVIVSDLRMPGGNGLDVLATATELHGVRVPIILMSALGDEETRARALKMGATTFISKPLNLDELHAALQSASTPHGATH